MPWEKNDWRMLSSNNFAYSSFSVKLFRMVGGWVADGWVAGESGYKAISASTGLELELWLSLAKCCFLPTLHSIRVFFLQKVSFDHFQRCKKIIDDSK